MFNHDYKEMLQSLQECNVEFILVGAYALAVHGYPRGTLDIDIWVNPTSENSLKVYNALAQFGAPLNGIDVNAFTEKGIVFQVGVAPRRIDFLTDISGGIKFDEAKERSKWVEVEGLSFNALSIEDLITNKDATGRPKDLADVKNLRRFSQKHNLFRS